MTGSLARALKDLRRKAVLLDRVIWELEGYDEPKRGRPPKAEHLQKGTAIGKRKKAK